MSDEKNSAGPTSGVPSRPPAVGSPGESASQLAENARALAGGDVPDARADESNARQTEPSAHEAATVAFFLPGGSVARRQAREILNSGKKAQKAKLVSLLLSYAEWDEIWALVDETTVRKLFPHLDLPSNLRSAWSRYLGLSAPD